MIQKKHTIHALLTTLLCMIAIIVLSCTNDTIENEQSPEVIKMNLQGGLQEFDDVTTRAVKSLPDGATILIRFDNGAYGAGVYSAANQEWEFTKTGGSLTTTSSASCTLYYAPSTTSGNSTSITLDPKTPVYIATGTYSCSSSILTVHATLEPATARVRFKGTTGTTISLSGLAFYSGIDVSRSSTLSSSSSSISLDVFSGGYTDYVYGYFADSNRELELTYDDATYKRTIGSSLFLNGQSGYISIPTSSALGEWKEEVTTHEYVDLGLSVMWATCNVGASSPEDYGDYYAWGETQTKSNYSWSTYLDSPNRDGNSFTKYNNNGGKTQLLPEDDVAHVKWKGTWRMPTKAEQDELREQCTWTWTSQGGKNGYKVTSKKNGNSIFLPAAGCRLSSDLSYVGSDGYYWSSSLNTSYSNYAYYLNFYSGNVGWSNHYRGYGLSVRPVCPNSSSILVSSITLNQTSLDLPSGSTYQLSETVSPSNASNKSVTWSSSNTDVATVSSSGLVTAKAAGSATITATAADGSGVKATCSVTVTTGGSGNGTENGHEYVDLGLSVKWATCNVGASSPEDYGDYYAWGETETKSYYYWSTYLDSPNRDGNSFTKYYNNGGKTQLLPEDDVAHVKWKGSWRMPTTAEQDELLEQCTWTWTSQAGKNGYKVRSKKNGNSIFLPAAGFRIGSSLGNAGSYGYYWSSSLSADFSSGAYGLYFDSGNVSGYNSNRGYGLSVRPVCP